MSLQEQIDSLIEITKTHTDCIGTIKETIQSQNRSISALLEALKILDAKIQRLEEKYAASN